MMLPNPYGTLPTTPSVWWPQLEASLESADYSFEAVNEITVGDTLDPIVSFSIAAMPSGTGEVVISSPSLNNGSTGEPTLITVWLSQGVPGRIYTYRLVITTQADRVLPVYIGQVCDPLTATNPLPPAPTPGFGTPTNWP